MKQLLLFMLLLPLCSSGQIITTIAGCGIGDDSMAINSEVFHPHDIAVDRYGNAYIAEIYGNRIRKVAPSGIITTIAGTIAGNGGYSGDGGPATSALLNYPSGIAVDPVGDVYVSDAGNYRVRKIDTLGIITTIAGIGTAGFSGDGFAATAAQITPAGIAIDSVGSIFIADGSNNRVRRIDTSGIITTVAGNGLAVGAAGFYGDGGMATAANLYSPINIAFDKHGNLLISDFFHYAVRRVDDSGIMSTIAGIGYFSYSGDGGPATDAAMKYPIGLAVDSTGNIYIGDEHNFRVRMVDTAGIITTVAGNGNPGFSGDGGPADSAMFDEPTGITFDAAGNMYVADMWNNRVRKINTTGTITTFAGQNGLFDDGIAATHAEISEPYNIAVDAPGNVYFPDYYNNRIRKLSVTGIITTVAGNGISGFDAFYSGDGGPADSAQIYLPTAVAVDAHGNIYIADAGNDLVRKVDAAGIITTIAGNGLYGFTGDGGPATAAEIEGLAGVAVDTAGNVYIADEGNYRIRKINTSDTITTVAGNGAYTYSGDDIAAVTAAIDPQDVAVDAAGNIYIADGDNYRIRKVDSAGIITTIAGTGTAGYTGDGGAATAAEISSSGGVKTDAQGDIYFADSSEHVRMINDSGIIYTIAGNGVSGFSGDGGMATAAELNGAAGVAIDAAGDIYIADGYNYRIRKVSGLGLSVPAINSAKGSILVYPNPTQSTLIITSAIPITNVAITNLLGQVVHSQTANATNIQVDVADIPSGVYFVKINGTEVQKFVKE